MSESDNVSFLSWYVMRDLKRVNAKMPAYKMLEENHFEVFTPMKWRLTTKSGKQIREQVPFIQDLLFVHATKELLDVMVEKTLTLQYRYIHGTYMSPMTVRDKEMNNFIYAVNATDSPKYYMPEEITPDMCKRNIRIIGGPLNGYEGKLLTIRGSKVKRLIVNLSGLFSVGVEVKPDMIEFV